MKYLFFLSNTLIQPNRILLSLVVLGLILGAACTSQAQTTIRGQRVRLGNQTIDHLSSGDDLSLDGTTVTGNVAAGREVTGENCRVEGNLSAGRDVELANCSFIKRISAGRDLTLRDTQVAADVAAGKTLSLLNTQIGGNAMAGAGAEVDNSRIDGTLSLATENLTLKRSTLNNIHINNLFPRFTSGSVTQNGNIVMGNSSIVTRGSFNGGSVVSVGSNSTSNVNGYTVKSSGGQTTLITPTNTVYVNSQKVHGDGPSSYSEYRSLHPGAPHIQGPGWTTNGSNTESAHEAPGSASPQVVALMDNTIVTGTITFEAGGGKVVVYPGSRFTGNVVGGTLEKRAGW